MIFQKPIDNYDFLRRGWARSSLEPHTAGAMLRRIKALEYVPMPSDHCDAGPRGRGLVEGSPAVSQLLANIWKKAVQNDLGELSSHYRTNADRSVTTVVRLGSGYSLDWHNHLAAGCTATLLIYLFDGPDRGHGGDLVLGEVQRGFSDIRETQRFEIGHGDAIMIGDASHPLMMHKAERWEGEGHRYLVSFAFNGDDW